MKRIIPCEGDIHDIVCVGGHSFTIRYGYYDEAERCSTEPLPVYPCFISNPAYTKDGHPLVTRIQDACEFYSPQSEAGDGWCADCTHCDSQHEVIGICRCVSRKANAASM